MMNKTILHDKSGLTLVELMIVMVLSLLLMAAVYLAYQAHHIHSLSQEQVLTAQQDLRAVMDILERDIRNAGCDPADPPMNLVGISTTSGAFPSSNVTKLGLSMDLDGDSNTTGVDEVVSYIWNHSTGELTRNGRVLANGVTNLTFTYSSSGADKTPATNSQLGAAASEVRTIEITLEVRSDKPDPDTGKYITRTFTREVKGRNLGL
ncbi:MAG TPA: prepilin-type N-terminal cleavage/methylation domain-containing protein [Deltaproteobacteria bacterium]|jgi:prepilin-type N-terminal cleavage/methylation domain-containing protein|nr:prepilin-type N-terminal cleavage/methylation domain-containing protein [Pseudomonadota bacterium]HNU75865.1 prepilin-type N-terminal cleavage/methylation domain-containing protein [Deltaproteobacteria bacterium]HOD69793.1 prepilin-type N-terminal cleavage/methylation domain-containing protein [Deltaproteobacteria bacterium]HON61068.1 prepilin-type N-terminal cleavage/methylation domain-containing protein [Deltaproteobacteria bacterium]HOS27584.1 prepilin-type N-terminal cleavage/methylation